MLSYEEKKFRQKPYTQCFDCIQGNRLKCKKCMAQLVDDIVRHRQKTEAIKHQSNNQEPFRRTMKIQTKVPAELEVRSNYQLWMEQVGMRRSAEKNLMSATISCWPHKKLGNRKKLHKIEGPKYGTWESRLLARFAKSQEVFKSLERGLSLRC